MSQDFERRVFEIGSKLLEQTQSSSFFRQRDWYQKMLVWTMKSSKLKTNLFRFIDVLPNLSDDKQFLSYWKEYFKDMSFMGLAQLSPSLFASSVKKQLLKVAQLFIAGADTPSALKVISENWEKNLAFTVDLLGEATLSEKEALFYQKSYLHLIKELSRQSWPYNETLQNPNVSIKASALFSQIKEEAWLYSKTQIKDRLRPLFQQAISADVFINLDMEQYKYKDLYLEIFKELLMEEDFKAYPHFGIVIQAYLTDSLEDLKALIRFSERRGQKIQIRLVKGAYWDSEVLLARQKNWPIPVFTDKNQTDENFEKCLALLFKSSVKIAVASHNIRSIACALVQKEDRPKTELEFQFLYGMLEPLALALAERGHLSRIYCPVGDLIPGMSYFVRRLLENSANQSFVLNAMMKKLSHEKLLAKPQVRASKSLLKDKEVFSNHPLPDFSRPESRKAFKEALAYWKPRFPLEAPILVNGKAMKSPLVFKRENPSCPDQILSHVFFANSEIAKTAVQNSQDFFPKWKAVSPEQRIFFLRKTAKLLKQKFFYLSALQVFEVGKTWSEACADVCEAIDFCSYYALSYEKLSKARLTDEVSGEESFLTYEAKGLAVVIAPWNFPLAILTGMTAAPLLCGNTVLIKPAEQSSLTAYEFVKILLEAGWPRQSFAFLPGLGEEVGEALVQSPKVSILSFTGSFEVGQKIIESSKKISESHFKSCVVEMGGKNAIVIDSSADLDLAVEGVLFSAFGFQGQKCSACSRLIVLDDIYDKFMERFLPAVESLVIGNPESPESFLGPLVDKEAFLKIQSFVEKEKAKLLYPASKNIEKIFKSEGYFMSPLVYLSDSLQSPLMQEELFAPILACYRAQTLEKAFQAVNQSAFALTAGLYSRHPGHIQSFKSQVEAGNLYINRNCTGALVKRHPFGGWKSSGLGSKAGGEDYLKSFLQSKVSTENKMRRGFSPEIFNL